MIINSHGKGGIFYGRYQDECPGNQGEQAQDDAGRRVMLRERQHRAEGIERAGADITKNDAQRAPCKQG